MFGQVLKAVMLDLFMLAGCAVALAVFVCAFRFLIGLVFRPFVMARREVKSDDKE